MNQYKSKADKIREYLKLNPDASPRMVSKVLSVSYGYAYKITKEENAKRITAEVVTRHVKETTVSSKPKRTTRKLRVCWKRLVKKFMRLTGLPK